MTEHYIPYIDKFPLLNEKIDTANNLISRSSLMSFYPVIKIIQKTIKQINTHQYCRDPDKVAKLFKRVRIDNVHRVLFKPMNDSIDKQLTKYIVDKNRYPHISADDVNAINGIVFAFRYLDEDVQLKINQLFEGVEDAAENGDDENIIEAFRRLITFVHNVLICDWPFVIDNILNSFMRDIKAFNSMGMLVSINTVEKYNELLYWEDIETYE